MHYAAHAHDEVRSCSSHPIPSCAPHRDMQCVLYIHIPCCPSQCHPCEREHTHGKHGNTKHVHERRFGARQGDVLTMVVRVYGEGEEQRAVELQSEADMEA